MSWTEERIEELKKLAAEGYSAARIARTLGGGLTRNAVIGKRKQHYLTPDERNALKAALRAGGRVVDLARQFNVSERTVTFYRDSVLDPVCTGGAFVRVCYVEGCFALVGKDAKFCDRHRARPCSNPKMMGARA